jgi:cyanophycinase-like exopeptidase
MGPVLLAGSGQPTTKIFRTLIRRALDPIKGRKPKVALSLAPIAESPAILRKFVGWFSPAIFCGAEVERFTVAGEPDAIPEKRAREIVERADQIFLSGGDPVAGARLYAESGADVWLREARARGAALAGGSAGAILLGAFWATWPDEPDGRPFDGGELVRCTGVVPDLVVDTHAEEDEWAELLLVRDLLDARGVALRLRGIPTGGGLVVDGAGALEAIGDPPFQP